MIPIDLFDYSKNRKFDIVVTRYVNDNLAAIVAVVIDFLNEDPEYDIGDFLPADYVKNKPIECRQLFDTLYQMIKSETLRDYYIKPKYQYLLHQILSWWDDCTDDESDLIPIPLNAELRVKIENEETYLLEDKSNYVLNNITNYEEYSYFCFPDFDFLNPWLSDHVSLYLQYPELFARIRPDVYLDDYIDLMDIDLRELYQDKTRDIKFKNNTIDINMGIIREILSSLISLEQRKAEIEKREEVEISNDIYYGTNRSLKINYDLESTREMTIGRANAKLGETDLYIYKNCKSYREDYVVVENKYIEDFKTQYGQLLGYLNPNFKFGLTISINKRYKLIDAVDFIIKCLNEINDTDTDFPITEICKPFNGYPYVVMSTHIIPEDKTAKMSIYHLILNLYDEERKNLAKRIRKKKK